MVSNIKKAGLDYLHPDQADVIYDILFDRKSQIDKSPDLLNKWKKLGSSLTKK